MCLYTLVKEIKENFILIEQERNGVVFIVAMFRTKTNSKQIEELIEALIKSDFYSSIREELNISDEKYLIKKYPFRLKEGYPAFLVKASAILNEDGSQIREVVFFTESISNDINNTFSRITIPSMFYKIVKVYVKFILIHELVHVQQIKNGMKMEEYRKTEYEDNEFERQANMKAVEILSKEGELQRVIANMIANKKGIIDNVIASELMTRFSK